MEEPAKPTTPEVKKEEPVDHKAINQKFAPKPLSMMEQVLQCFPYK